MITTHEDAILAGDKPGGHDGPEFNETVNDQIARYALAKNDPRLRERTSLPFPIPFLPQSEMIEEQIKHTPLLDTKSEYLWRLLTAPDRFQDTLDRAIVRLKPIAHTFQAIAFIGTSGALLAPVLALHFKKQLLLVRKPDVSTHSDYKTEGVSEACNYLFVDDMIASGATINEAVDTIEDDVPGSKLRAVYCYNADSLTCRPGEFISGRVYIAT